jgi:hypothetical protein
MTTEGSKVAPDSALQIATYAKAGGTLNTLCTTVLRAYQLYQSYKDKDFELDEGEQSLLGMVRDIHVSCGCSNAAAPPKEFEYDAETKRPRVVEPGEIALRFQPTNVQRSMRIEIVELVELLSVLEDVPTKNKKPCALWQVVLELKRWMATELPLLLDEVRGPENWESELNARVKYLKKLVALCRTNEMDPLKKEKNWREFFGVDEEKKDRRERRFTRVMYTLQAHLKQIRNDHAHFLSERVTTDLLQQLEHSIKGVVRPTMHAALIVLSKVRTTDGMVFSELAADTEGKWSWMDEMKGTKLCKMLTVAIRKDKPLQRALHIVTPEVSGARLKSNRQLQTSSASDLGDDDDDHDDDDDEQFSNMQAQYDTVYSNAEDVLEVLAKKNDKEDTSGMPRGATERAKELLEPRETFREALRNLGIVNNVLAHNVGKGLTILRKTQMLAKQYGQLMFVKTCQVQVNTFLGKLCSIVERMVDTVLKVVEHMEFVRQDLEEYIGTDLERADQKGTQYWSENVDKAAVLVDLAIANKVAVNMTVTEICQLAKTGPGANDMAKMKEEWDKCLHKFGIELNTSELEPEPETPELQPSSGVSVGREDTRLKEGARPTDWRKLDKTGDPRNQILVEIHKVEAADSQQSMPEPEAGCAGAEVTVANVSQSAGVPPSTVQQPAVLQPAVVNLQPSVAVQAVKPRERADGKNSYQFHIEFKGEVVHTTQPLNFAALEANWKDSLQGVLPKCGAVKFPSPETAACQDRSQDLCRFFEGVLCVADTSSDAHLLYSRSQALPHVLRQLGMEKRAQEQVISATAARAKDARRTMTIYRIQKYTGMPGSPTVKWTAANGGDRCDPTETSDDAPQPWEGFQWAQTDWEKGGVEYAKTTKGPWFPAPSGSLTTSGRLQATGFQRTPSRRRLEPATKVATRLRAQWLEERCFGMMVWKWQRRWCVLQRNSNGSVELVIANFPAEGSAHCIQCGWCDPSAQLETVSAHHHLPLPTSHAKLYGAAVGLPLHSSLSSNASTSAPSLNAMRMTMAGSRWRRQTLRKNNIFFARFRSSRRAMTHCLAHSASACKLVKCVGRTRSSRTGETNGWTQFVPRNRDIMEGPRHLTWSSRSSRSRSRSRSWSRSWSRSRSRRARQQRSQSHEVTLLLPFQKRCPPLRTGSCSRI